MKRYYKICKLKFKGSIDVKMMFFMCLFFLLCIVATIMPYFYATSRYIKLNQVVRKYMLRMETTGVITPTDKTSIEDDLASMGFNVSKVSIETIPSVGTKAGYGQDISIRIQYTYDYKIITLVGIVPKMVNAAENFDIKKVTVSKKG